MEINFNSINIDDSGRVAFSGLGSGIDFIAAVDAIIEARRIPIDRLETKIETNEAKIAAYQEFRSVLNAFQGSFANIRGAATVGKTADIFSAKEAFASVSRTDGATPSSAAALLGVTVTNAAGVGTHNIEILQTAAAHKISSDAYTSTTTALGLTEGNTFTIEGKVITVSEGDTLLSLRDRINNANTGTSPSKVSASIVSVSATENYLVLTKDTAGTSITISDTSGTPLQTVGILTSGPAIKNLLQAAQKAQFYADGLIDKTNEIYESARQSASTNTLGSSGTIHFDDGNTTLDLAYLTGDTIQGLADKINGDSTLTDTMGISASVVTEGGQVRLKIQTTGDAFTMTETGGGSVLTDLAIGNARLLIERETNSVTDLFAGVTLSLFQAEVGTNIKIDIEQDLNAIKAELQSFVDAFNALKTFINTQSNIDENTGKISEDAVLFGDRTLSAIDGEIARIIGTGTQGVSGDFTVLAQIGIDFIDNGTLSDPLLSDTIEIDSEKLDNALLNNVDDVRRMFTFDFSSSDPRLVYLTSTGQTVYDSSGYTLNVAYDDRFKSDSYVALGSFTQIDADTGGPAEDGISDIAFGDPVISGQAFRYSYDEATEVFTVRNLTLGTNETYDITTDLDTLVGVSNDLGAGQTLSVPFPTLGVTITLSGDNSFARATKITDGTLDVSGIGNTNGGNMTGGTVSTPTGTMDKLTVDALIAAGVYNQATGLLTLPLESDGGIGGVSRINTAAGIKFKLDAGSVVSDISATDLDDSSTHTIEIYVTDSDLNEVLVATLTDYTFSGSTQDGTGTFTIDLGTGLIAETSSVISATSPMQNYLTDPTLGDGNFDITDSTPTLIDNFAYNATDSLTDLAALIDADPDLSASVVSSGGVFYLEVTHTSNNENLIFTNDTDSLIAQLNMSDQNNVLLSANINGATGGADDGSVTVSGSIITATDQTGADGLKLLYTGTDDVDGVTLNYTVGLGAQLFHALDAILDVTAGSVENEIDALDDQNLQSQERVNEMLARLEQQRQSLISRFIAMETALITMNRILDQMRTSFDALTASQAR